MVKKMGWFKPAAVGTAILTSLWANNSLGIRDNWYRTIAMSVIVIASFVGDYGHDLREKKFSHALSPTEMHDYRIALVVQWIAIATIAVAGFVAYRH